jgi:hypothetical protein
MKNFKILIADGYSVIDQNGISGLDLVELDARHNKHFFYEKFKNIKCNL